MEPELKKYLDTKFDSVELQIGSIESRMASKSDVEEVLQVVKDVAQNTGQIIDRFENDFSDLRQRIEHTSKRIEYLEKKLL